jgi:spore germination protein
MLWSLLSSRKAEKDVNKAFPWLVVFTLLSSGISCREQRYLPEIGIVRQLGVEFAPDKRLLFTQIFSRFADAQRCEQVIVSKANLFHDAWDNAGYIAPLSLKFGKLQQLLVSEQLARQDIDDLTNFFFRDYQKPPQALLVIVAGSPKKLLEKAAGLPSQPPAFSYIHTLLKNNYGRYLSKLSLLQFSVWKFAPGIDPIAPVVNWTPEGIHLAGSALFAGGRLVGRIDNTATNTLMLMMGQLKDRNYVLQSPINLNPLHPFQKVAAVDLKTVHRQLRFIVNRNKPLVNLMLKVEGNVEEYIWDDLDQPVAEEKLEKKISQALEKDCAKLLHYARSIGSDPLGFGDILRAKYYQYWKKYKWQTVYSQIEIKVKVDFKMKRYGMIK